MKMMAKSWDMSTDSIKHKYTIYSWTKEKGNLQLFAPVGTPGV